MAKNISAADASASWQSGMAGAGAKYTKGVQRVTEAPTAKAATEQAMQDYAAGCQASVSSGKRRASLQAVSLQYWQQQAVQFGASKLAAGAQKGKAKYDQWVQQKGLAAWQAASDAAAAVQGPKGDEGTALAKVAAAMRAMKAAKK